MIRYAPRPRAPSPPRTSSDESDTQSDSSDSENTYSVVQDNVSSVNGNSNASSNGRFNKQHQPLPPPPPPKLRDRKFGDSVNASPTGSVMSSSSDEVVLKSIRRNVDRPSNSKASLQRELANNHEKGLYDAATVEEIKAHFQRQIEAMIRSQERNGQTITTATAAINTSSTTTTTTTTNNNNNNNGRLANNKKSFMEARDVVQKHIERMFSASNENEDEDKKPGVIGQHRPIKHVAHGVNHATSLENDTGTGVEPSPPPMHLGVSQAIKNMKHKGQNHFNHNHSEWKSVESLLREQQINEVNEDDPEDERDAEVNEKMRKLKMEHGKSLPNLSGLSKDVPSNPSSCASSEAGLTSVSQQQQFQSASSIQTEGVTPTVAPESLLAKEYVKHKIDYLGSLPIGSKSTNLSALQRPLKDLYFKWRALRNLGQTNLPGTLEINDTGLRVQYVRELHKGVQEIFNPFPTIAVWAAVKFVHRRDVTRDGNVNHKFAFLPLISDPDSQEKHRLFHDLDFHEVELAADAPHPPIFACVMRRTGVPKHLECHGFVCTSSEDAIIIAANLYQALLDTMKKQKAKMQQRKKSSAANSVASSSRASSGGQRSSSGLLSDSADSSAMPVRPPRRKKKHGTDSSKASSVTSSENGLVRKKSLRSSNRSTHIRKATTVSYDPTRRSIRAQQIGGGLARFEGDPRGKDLTRKSMRRRSQKQKTKSSPALNQPDSSFSASGDLYTRVAIPRSKSFMNVSSQYNLQELFKELKEKEGVESVDDVLKKILSPNGISFNEIKPVYRELLMKLAMTMSQDELFERSKNILSQERKRLSVVDKKTKQQKSKDGKIKEQSGSNSNTLSSFFRLTFSGGGKKNAIENNSSNSSGYESGNTKQKTSIKKADISGPLPHQQSLLDKPPSSNHPGFHSLQRKHTSKQDKSKAVPKVPTLPRSSKIALATKPDDDNIYESCSECGAYEGVAYDTCTSCKVKVRSKIPMPKGEIHEAEEIYCDCDGDSCVSSEKCYCSLRKDPRKDYHQQSKHSRPSVVARVCSTNNKTIIHCPGSTGLDTMSSATSTTTTSCSICSGGSQAEVDCSSGSTATDTTCYSIKHHRVVPVTSGSRNSLLSLSACESPQTAWRRNTKHIMEKQQQHMQSQSHHRNNHHMAAPPSCSECSSCCKSSSAASSNDSAVVVSPVHPKHRHQKFTKGSDVSLSCCCSVSSSGSRCNNSSSGCCCYSSSNASTLSGSGMKRANSKMLLLSAVDKSGRVMYRGTSSSSSTLSNGSSRPLRSSSHSTLTSRDAAREAVNVLSMKKSAEIAATFSGARINQTTNIVNEDNNNRNNNSFEEDHDDGDDVVDDAEVEDAYESRKQHCQCNPLSSRFSKANMHSSLGYFP